MPHSAYKTVLSGMIAATSLLAVAQRAAGQCETDYLIAQPGEAGSWFGKSLAMSRGRAVIAAYHTFAGGTAFALQWDGRQWAPDGELAPPDGRPGDSFGRGADVAGDLAVLGAPDHDGAADRSGAVYVFERVAGRWLLRQKLLAADADAADQFGWSAAIGSDSILVGARGDDQGGENNGAAYVFQHDGAQWRQTQKLISPQPVPGAVVGYCIDADGAQAAVGAPWDGPLQHGAAYVYRERAGTWELERRVAAPAGQPDRFGLSVAISGDALLVGAPERVVLQRGATGAGFVFRRSGSVWSFEQGLVAEESVSGNRFGYSVGLDGGLALIGAYDSNQGFGSAYTFRFNGVAWRQAATILQSDFGMPDPLGAPPWFGQAVALAGDRALVGAPHDDNKTGGDAGTVYGFSGLIDVDCNSNSLPDGCDIADGRSGDLNLNGVPDECEPLQFLPGDLNCDQARSAFDIDPFVLALFDPPAYVRQFPQCDRRAADMNGDDRIDAFDVDPFVDCLFNLRCP